MEYRGVLEQFGCQVTLHYSGKAGQWFIITVLVTHLSPLSLKCPNMVISTVIRSVILCAVLVRSRGLGLRRLLLPSG